MTATKFDDRSLSVFFTIIGVLGIAPALYGIFVAGWVLLMTVSNAVAGHGLNFAAAALYTGFLSVTFFGFWLLLQYTRRARNKRASVSHNTLWQLTTVQNVIYLLASLAFFIESIDHGVSVYSSVGVMWFAILTALAAHAANKAPAPSS